MRSRAGGVKRLRVTLVTLVVASALVAVDAGAAPVATAATAEQFESGMIIADTLFYDGSAMSKEEIQAFLDAKVGTCQNSLCLNVLQVSYGGRAREVSSKTGRLVCEAIPGGFLSAAEIIYRAQTACGISAKVILVTLQKEQGLVTSRAPTVLALSHAMGMACSDSAPCDPTFSGFALQVVGGARQLKAYYAAAFARQPGYHSIGYHPNADCLAKTINIQNYATAALYNYTPYQPNAAALANLYGSGDSCSSYGNRNFFRYYTDWFGSTQGEQYISRTDAVDYLVGIDPRASMWAYPVTAQSGWRPRVTLGVGWNGIETLVGIGDFNGNGQRDLIGVDSAKKAWLYIGDGQLAYPNRVALAVDWSTAKFIVYGGNANGDNGPDVYTVDQAGVLWLWRGTGTGTFQAAVQVGPGYGDATLVVGPGDLNGDECGDLLVRRAAGDLSLLAGNCAGGFAAPVNLGAGWSTIVGIYSIDFTGDGALDLLARSSAGQLHLWRGDGVGRIQYVGVVDSGWSTMGPVVGAGPIVLPTATGPVPMPVGATGLGDFDRDGKRDFYGITFAGEMRLYRGTGNGGVLASTPVLAPTWGVGVRTFPAGDFNSDGYQDVGRTTNAGDMEVAYGGAGGTLGTPQRISTGWPAYNLIMGGFDWDGDRKPDVLARDDQGRLWLYRGSGTGTWISATPTQIDSGWSPFTSVFAAGDFDGKGGVDLLARTSEGVLRLYPSDGHGGFGTIRSVDAGWSGFSVLFSPGDFDGSAGPDVLARAADGRLYLYSGNGRGGFSQQFRLVDSGWNTMWWIG